MKKLFLIGCLILTVACQNVAATPTVEPTQIAATQTPPEPATATMTFTPAPTATTTPLPLYFTEEFNTDMSVWDSFQTGGEIVPTVTLANDSLQIGISSPNTWYYAINTSHEYQNVSVIAKFSGTPSGSVGLICRYTESGWYEFNIASDGTYSVLLAQRLSEGIAQYSPIAADEGQYLQAGNLNYEMGLTCRENTLFLYVDGNILRKLDVSHYGLTEGKIGINASSFEETPMTATFDWVKVSEPSQ
jgi:hypothetical protein